MNTYYFNVLMITNHVISDSVIIFLSKLRKHKPCTSRVGSIFRLSEEEDYDLRKA